MFKHTLRLNLIDYSSIEAGNHHYYSINGITLPDYIDSVLNVSIGSTYVTFQFSTKTKRIMFGPTPDIDINVTSIPCVVEYYSLSKDRELKLNQLIQN